MKPDHLNGRGRLVSTSETAPNPKQGAEPAPSSWVDRAAGIGTDWWATIVAGVIVLLAVAGVLPKIPW
jgi:hypothetical protein